MIIIVDKTIARFAVVLLVIGVGVFITIVSNPGDNAAPIIDAPSLSTTIESRAESLDKSGTMGAVTVDVQPKQLESGVGDVVFSVAFNTHSVELDFDFTKIISLEDNLGNSYSAREWTGNSGWHHVNGDIIFPSIDVVATYVTLTITTIEGQTLQFSWDVQK